MPPHENNKCQPVNQMTLFLSVYFPIFRDCFHISPMSDRQDLCSDGEKAELHRVLLRLIPCQEPPTEMHGIPEKDCGQTYPK